MYYIKIFIFNISYIKYLSLNLFNLVLCNLNNLIINALILILIYTNLLQLKNTWKFLIIILYIYYINTSEFSILYNFYFGYYKIHPIILYFGIITLLYRLILNKNIFKFILFYVVVSLIIAFILGSLWALYQSQWGTYWSNDSIEIILLFFIIVGLICIHVNYKNYIYSFFFLIQSIVLLGCLRYNLVYTKHNFFKKIININAYQYIIYFNFILLLIRRNFYKYSITLLLSTRIIFYILILEVFFNLINIKIFLYFNNLLILFVFIYFSVNIINFLKKKKVIHITCILLIFIFNLFDLIYQKKNNMYINLSLNNLNNYFYYTKNSNFLFFFLNYYYKNIYLFNNNNSLLLNKIFNFSEVNKSINIIFINYF